LSRIKWLPEALADIERLYRFLHDKNSDTAARAARAIIDGANALGAMPDAGRPMPDDTQRREWIILFGAGAYVLRYLRERNDVIIIRVWHSRENRD